MLADKYFASVQDILTNVFQTQIEKIREAATILFDAARQDGSLYAFGCNHAGILAEELFYRTGGLAIINPIMIPGLTMDTRPITLTTAMERVNGLGKVIAANYALKAGDALIIHSVSGRNSVPVDLAIYSRSIGVKVIGLTNVTYSQREPSRHPSGKRLWEVCDLVLDNCGCYGDAEIEVKGLEQKVAPTSTAVGAVILNAIVAEVVERFVENGMVPPLFMSSNMEGGDEYNNQVLNQYRAKILYL